ncbi:major facilitator superfamily domain-containing protein [Podospora fimiseda]|uniref:Major facilitator superfamily domain-containing protein n=1 Tax=Podospora fimiseda TaxID=252190 RepID=A0AAN7BK02_9PEZI|nr:major facilitator superfamily domain-containing protein [Podospora fimiseda]
MGRDHPPTSSSNDIPLSTLLSPPSPHAMISRPSEASLVTLASSCSTLRLKEEKLPQETREASDQHDGNYLDRLRLWSILAALTVIMFLAMLDTSIVSTAIPVITNEFGSVRDIGWYGSGYQLANACMQPLAGKLYSFYTLKFVFLAFVALFEIGSTVCGTARSSFILIIGRALAGLGAAGIIGGSTMILAAVVPLEKRPAVSGIGLGISQLGLVLGPLLGGFLLNLPIGVAAALPLICITIPEQCNKPKRPTLIDFLAKKMDLVGFLLLTPAATLFLLALHYGGEEYDWNHPFIVALFVGSVGSLVMFLFVEARRGANALLPLHILKRRVVWCSCLVMMFSVATSFCTTYFLPIYFQAVKNADPIQSGIYLMPNIVSQLLGGIISGLLVSKLGYYLPWSVGAGMLLTVGCGLISTYGPETGLSKWIGYQAVLGLGRGLGMQIPIIALQSFLPADELAVGTAIIMFGHTMGAAVFLSAGESMFLNGLRKYIPLYAPAVDPEEMIANGFIKKPLSGKPQMQARLPGELAAICKAINRVFYMTSGAGGGSFLFAFGMGWKSVKAKEDPERQVVSAEREER